jgi:hypothetical protein
MNPTSLGSRTRYCVPRTPSTLPGRDSVPYNLKQISFQSGPWPAILNGM